MITRQLFKNNLRTRIIFQFRQNSSSTSSSYPIPMTEDNIQFINVRREGDDIDDNYSLIVDGLVNTKSAYRNARVSTIVNQLPAKIEAGKIVLKGIEFAGDTTVAEAGEKITQEDFKAILESTREYLSNYKELFFEDLGLGAAASTRIGARVISDNPAHSLIFRSLLINIPNRVPQHLERFNGWNLHNRFENSYDKNWDGTTYHFEKGNEIPKKGERPIVAYIGGSNNLVGVQFEQIASHPGLIAGANIIAGEKSSIRGVVNAFVIAATTMINSENPYSIALPSFVLSKNGKTTVIVGNLSDGFIAKASASGSLYGAYANTLSEVGVSAIFNGVIAPSSQITPQSFHGFTFREPYPSVVSNDISVKVLNPDNFISPATSFVFIGSETSLSVDDAATKITQLVGDESKNNLAKLLLSSAKINVVNSENDLLSLI